MAVGFPENPINKKQFVVEKKVFEYNSELGTWNVGTKGHVSANTGTVADVSDLTDTNSILTNAGRTLPVYATESALLSVNVDTIRDGQMAFVTATNNIHVFYNRKWFGAPTSAFTPPPAYSWGGDKAVIAGGYTTSNTRTANMQTTNIVTGNDTAGFGNLTVARNSFSAASDTTYGLFIAGQGNSGQVNVIDRVVIAELAGSGATDFGDTNSSFNGYGAVSDGTNAIHNQGNVLWTVAFATPGNASSFGADSTAPLRQFAGTCNDATYGIWGGGANTNNISYINMQTPGTSGDFGDLNMSNEEGSGTDSSSGRGIFAGGKQSNVRTNIIDYIEIATPSNATDFGDLTIAMETASASDGTYGLISTSTTLTTTINKITFDTPGSAVSFGTLNGGARSGTAATSGSSS